MAIPQAGNGELIFSDNEYDVLEKILITLECPEAVFQRLGDYLFRIYDCAFVLFCTKPAAGKNNIRYYKELIQNAADPDAQMDERLNSGVLRQSLFVHEDGSFSVPFQCPDSLPGFLFVGFPVHSSVYSDELKRKMVPIIRILNKSLVYVEAGRIRTERNRLKYAFSKYVSPELVTTLLAHPEEIQPGGRKEILSIVFTDLQGFTTLSDRMQPEKLVRVLNMYLNEMSQVIISLGGTIDKYEGDAIMAFFGAPKKMEDHAVRCCLAALRMTRMERVLNEQLFREKLITEPLHTRIGINTGSVIVGNIGSMQRLDYTIIGSNVNIAARIENSNKEYHTTILISEYTYELVAPYFECRYIDVAYLKGVKIPVGLYELLYEKQGVIPNYMNAVMTEVESVTDEAELEELA